MEEVKKLILQADDEYLTGLSNKGTVKRAAKDLEAEKPEVSWEDGEAEVTLKDAVCRIKAPLAESSCSCPSRSICRHRIAAILYLRRILAGDEEGAQNGEEQGGEEQGGEAEAQKAAGETETKKPAEEGQAGNGAAGGETLPEEPLQALLEEMRALPLKRLQKACGSRVYRGFVARAQAGEFPAVERGSIITVRLSWENAVVKLLHPLEYSACSCHSRELCSHKAQAILAVLLESGALTLKELSSGPEETAEWDYGELSQAAQTIREEIGLQLATGLSRLSPEAGETMERLAVISHGAGLADFETDFRSVSAEYGQYFGRQAAFREERLLERLLSLYRRACRLEQAKEAEEVSALAGVFREEYRPVPRLHLTAVGARHFHSKAGYEGERYYFLEAEQKKWYTWTDARPTFYEGTRRRPAGRGENGPAPWGLGCSREKMMDLEFYLLQAKAAADGRLSVSQETKSEIVGKRDLNREEIREMVVRDYRRLLGEEILPAEAAAGGEPLALVEARTCREGTFDSVRQRFSMEIFDRDGRSLFVSVNYSKEERLTIQALERMSRRQEGKGEPVLFFGVPFLEEGRLRLYPIEIFSLPESEAEAEAEEMPSAGMEGAAAAHPEEAGPEGTAAACLEEIGIKGAAAGPKAAAVSAQTVRVLEQFLKRLRRALADLFQCGLSSVQEETGRELSCLEAEGEALGLHRAAEELARLNRELEARRHRMEKDAKAAILSWGFLMEYVQRGLRRTALDQAMAAMDERREMGKGMQMGTSMGGEENEPE